MASFDFAVTVAFDALLAGVAMSNSSVLDGLTAAATLLTVQAAIAIGRGRIGLARLVDNEPVLLMRHGELLVDNLHDSRVTADDVRAKLREANVFNYHDVEAVVLETTGDVSVLHGGSDFDESLLTDVRR